MSTAAYISLYCLVCHVFVSIVLCARPLGRREPNLYVRAFQLLAAWLCLCASFRGH